jgi:hypothetical protein
MPLPSVDQYNEAVQHPRTAFTDPELQTAQAKTNAMGIPQALGGSFALTYTFTGAAGNKWAVRCFHKAANGLNERYAIVSRTLNGLNSPYFVDFTYQSQGIRVNGTLHPIVKMAWVEGETLGSHLDRIYRDPARLQTLRQQFRQLGNFLRRQNIAHGDLQNGNIMVGRDLRLIDYDGLYVPGLPTGQGTELGHRHFQHPHRQARDHGPWVDRFSLISIDLSLQAVAQQTDLFKRFSNGENILFSANDYLDPDHSKVFAALRDIPALKPAVERFAYLCRRPVADLPTLEEFLTPTTAPRATPIPAAVQPLQQPARYVGAFDVLDATHFARGMEFIGQRIELIGKITQVKEGFTQTAVPKPYVFINFGNWRGQILKITLWSEGLDNLAEDARPNWRWRNRWISVTGLLDPPYSNRNFGYTHLSVTVTESNQMRLIDQNEAQWRLASIGQPLPDLPPTTPPPPPAAPRPAPPPPQPRSPAPPSGPSADEIRRSNQKIREGVRASATLPASSASASSSTVASTSSSVSSADTMPCPNCGIPNRVKAHSNTLAPICGHCGASLKPKLQPTQASAPPPPKPRPTLPLATTLSPPAPLVPQTTLTLKNAELSPPIQPTSAVVSTPVQDPGPYINSTLAILTS